MIVIPAYETLSLAESYKYCAALAKRTGRNFYFAFLTLPSERFRAMCVLYAFMRICDDLSDDLQSSTAERATQLTSWRVSLHRALDDEEFDHPVFSALVDVVARYQIPQELLFSVIDGVEMDLQPDGFESFDELSQYCYHVAGVVGLCCIYIWGFHDERAKAAAVDCGLAFQLTNILRDLGEDADRGRVYLPREDLRRFCYSSDDMARRFRNEQYRQLMEFEVNRARSYYRKAEQLFDYLDPPGQPILDAMLRIYGGLLEKIERHDYNVFSRRIRLSKSHKLLIAFKAVIRRRWLKR